MVVEEQKVTPHPHAELIKIWADNTSTKFQFDSGRGWQDCGNVPQWTESTKYRVKPEPVSKYRIAYSYSGDSIFFTDLYYRSLDEFLTKNSTVSFSWAQILDKTKVVCYE